MEGKIMVDILKWNWTPATILFLLMINGILEHQGIAGPPLGNIVLVLLIILGIVWALSGTAKLRRLSELYLWLVFILSLGTLKVIADRLPSITGMKNNLDTYIALSIVHLLIIGLALWILGAWKKETIDNAKPYLARLASGILIIGAAIVWIGAVTFQGMKLEGIAENRADHLFTSGCFVIGGIITLTGLAILTMSLRDAGDRSFSELGLLAILFGSTFWIIHLAFRVTVMVWSADELIRTGSAPSWYETWRMWSGLFYGIYMVMAYLSIAAYGASLLKTRMIARWLGRTCVIVGMAAAAMFAAQVPGFGLPLEIPILPFAISLFLLRRN